MLAFACCDFPETVLVNWILPWIEWAADDTRQFRHVQGSWAHLKIVYMIFIYLLFHRRHQFITSQLKDYSLPGGGGEGRVIRISSDRDDRRTFLGLKFLILGFFWAGKFC